MPQPLAAAKLTRAIHKAEALQGETIVLSGTTYPAVLSGETIAQDYGRGGARQDIRMIANVKRSYFQVPPFPGPPVAARGREWRLAEVHPNATTYDLVLESPKQ